jgi:hypothetical protein
MKYMSLFFFCILFTAFACVNDKKTGPCTVIIPPDIENSGLFDKNSLIKDSIALKLFIIFEQHFDDSVYIFSDNKLEQIKYIKTINNLGVCPDVVKIDYSNLDTIPKISLVMKRVNECISFYP